MKKMVNDFLTEIEDVKRFFGDSMHAFNLLGKKLQETRNFTLEMLQNDIPRLATGSINTLPYYYTEELSPTSKDSTGTSHHTLTQVSFGLQKDALSRNIRGGKNYFIVGDVCIVLIYQLWEEKYRSLFGSPEIDIFGDIRLIRNCILHNKGILTKKDYSKLKLIRFFDSEKRILIDTRKFLLVTSQIEKAVKRLEQTLLVFSPLLTLLSHSTSLG